MKKSNCYTYNLYGTNYNIELYRTNYTNNNTAILANTNEGEPFATLTVNLEDGLPANEAYLDTNNVNGVLHFLVENKLATPTGEMLQSGFCTYPKVILDLDKIPERNA